MFTVLPAVFIVGLKMLILGNNKLSEKVITPHNQLGSLAI
jgi:hypothetical protein